MFRENHDDLGSLRRRYGRLGLLFTVCFIVLLGRLFYVQIIRGDEYREAARTSFTTTEVLPARRGEVKDRNGVVLARNVPAHRLRLVPEKLELPLDPKVKNGPTRRASVLARIASTLEMTREEEEAVDAAITRAMAENRGGEPLLVRDTVVADRCPYDGAALEVPNDPAKDLEAAARPDIDAEHQLFCRECGLHYEPIASDAVYCPHDKGKLAWDGEGPTRNATCPKCKRHYATSVACPVDGQALTAVQHNLVCPVCKRRFTNELAVMESQGPIDGVLIDTVLMREYTQPFTLAHTLGYINRVTAEDLDQNPGVYANDAKKGRSGVEAALEAILRGKPGEVEYLKGTNRTVENSRRPSEPGLDVWLTIDARLQKEVRDILRYQRSAAAVVMDPNSGDILALYSHPGFDPNAWSGRLTREEWNSVSQNPYDPLHNKAVTAYAPGSVFKIVTALAGLREGIITADTTINCPGYYDFGGRPFRCHFHAGHGPETLVTALRDSCDVYFYQVAERMGMDKLAEYAREFGFGALSGVEIAESIGLVPTKKWHNDHTQLGFQPGLTLSVGIGQGSLTTTPLQVARSFAVIANGGRLVVPRLVSRYADEAGLERQEFLPVDERLVKMTPEQHALIEQGLVDVVNSPHGTGKEAKDPLVVVAGKTGTAEAPQSRPGASPEIARWLKENHAWFAMYAPVPDPQVVIVVFLEHGVAGGRYAAPLAKRIFDAWRRLGLYKTPLPEPDIDDQAPRAGDPPTGGGDLDDRDGPLSDPAPELPIRPLSPSGNTPPAPRPGGAP